MPFEFGGLRKCSVWRAWLISACFKFKRIQKKSDIGTLKSSVWSEKTAIDMRYFTSRLKACGRAERLTAKFSVTSLPDLFFALALAPAANPSWPPPSPSSFPQRSWVQGLSKIFFFSFLGGQGLSETPSRGKRAERALWLHLLAPCIECCVALLSGETSRSGKHTAAATAIKVKKNCATTVGSIQVAEFSPQSYSERRVEDEKIEKTEIHAITDLFCAWAIARLHPFLQLCGAKCRWATGSDFLLMKQSEEVSLCRCFAYFLIDPLRVFVECCSQGRENARSRKKKSISILRLQSGGAESLHSVTLLVIEGVYTSMTEQQYTFYGRTHLD